MEAEIVAFDERDTNIKLVRRWWIDNEAFSTIDEDMVFESILENNFESLVAFIGFSEQIGMNPKALISRTILAGNIDTFVAMLPPVDTLDENSILKSAMEEFLEKLKGKQIDNTKSNIRKKLFAGIRFIFGEKGGL